MKLYNVFVVFAREPKEYLRRRLSNAIILSLTMARMSTSKTNRVALVTGGAKRVGRAIVEKFAEAGFDIAFTFLKSEAEADDLASKLRSAGRICLPIKTDLTQPIEAAQIVYDKVLNQFGRLDVLVNNASLYLPTNFDRIDLDHARNMQAIHVESPLLLCQKFAALLRNSKGHVINMVDLLAERPWPQYLAYSASKAALWNLTLGLARKLAPEVTVNGIAPGVAEWPANYPESEKDKYLTRVPLARAGTPMDVAQTVHFLCTGGSYITGQIIRLDGGRSIT
jgi:pteridine reductase